MTEKSFSTNYDKALRAASSDPLRVGDKIRVHGFVMLKGLDDGKSYIVTSTEPFSGIPAYTFRKAGGQTRVRHEAGKIHAAIYSRSSGDLNGVEVIRNELASEKPI